MNELEAKELLIKIYETAQHPNNTHHAQAISIDITTLHTINAYINYGEEGLNMMFKSIKQDYPD